MLALSAQPNAAHLKLAELEGCGKLKAVVTQNIDGLHQAAGSKNVYELHGSVHRNYCMCCHKFYDVETIAMSTTPMDSNADLLIQEKLGEVFSKIKIGE